MPVLRMYPRWYRTVKRQRENLLPTASFPQMPAVAKAGLRPQPGSENSIQVSHMVTGIESGDPSPWPPRICIGTWSEQPELDTEPRYSAADCKCRDCYAACLLPEGLIFSVANSAIFIFHVIPSVPSWTAILSLALWQILLLLDCFLSLVWFVLFSHLIHLEFILVYALR